MMDKKMKKILTALLLLVSMCAVAQTDSWRAYMSYSEPQQIVKGDNQLYVCASDNLYKYSLTDQSITTYDKIRQLSDTNIERIAWNPTVKKLIIVYKNKNIDLLFDNDEVFNISSYMNRTMTQDKTINALCIYKHYAYLCTAFGLVKINMNRNEVSESYLLNRNIVAMGVADDVIYIKDKQGTLLSAKANGNLIDPNSWTTVATAPEGIFDQDNSAWNQYYDTVKALQPGGPRYNTFFFMKYLNNCLTTVGGGWKDGGEFARPACVQLLAPDDETWTIIGKDDVEPYSATNFTDATCLAYDPKDATHFFLATCGSGLYEFRNNKMVKNYTQGNSPLQSALPATHPACVNYVRVDALTFDNDGMLWMSCSAEAANKDNILRLNPATGEWKEYNDAILKYNNNILYILRKSIRDNKGNIWIVNDHHLHPCLIRINPETETFTRFDNFVNQDGTKYEVHYVRCVEQDLDGNIWIGTDIGLFMYNEAQQADETLGFTQVKVPRNDGTDLADYLLTNTDITCITIDGANRKWIGTNSSGVYLISADNYTQLHNFTTENSPLLSNTIESIAVNPNTGETFFGTDMGLCSYMSDASAAIDEMKSDDVYAFPNPVPPGYNGLITVRGLSMNADVKILTISGKLVAEGHSNGGTFTWNGCDQSGRRVASGVYMIATATKDGKKGVVAKVAVVQ